MLYIIALLSLPQIVTAVADVAQNRMEAPVADTAAATPDAPAPATTVLTPEAIITDTAALAADSTDSVDVHAPTTVVPDTFVPRLRPVLTRVDLDSPVQFSSSDSMLIIRRDSAFMYGNSEVTYGDIKLESANITMDLNGNTVYAVGVPDTAGEIQGRPVFSQGNDSYEAGTMRYNFRTQKGYITDVVTEQGEGYVTGHDAKRDSAGNIYLVNGRYTTCDHHDNPHFYFNLSKAKVRPGKNAVTGPAWMVLAGLPLPIAVPFGYFPFTESYASGIIVPTFGDDYQRGFYLRDGGYYFAINDNIDLALTGEIYTKGSWGITATSTYSRRYRYSGNFNLSYLKSIYGENGSPDYSKQTNFQILWSHSQDSKANPNLNFSASVNFTTSGYSRNDLNSYYSPAFTENTKSSTINLTYRFPNSKWSISSTFNVSQRTQDSTLAVSFPNFTLTLGQTNPFRRKRASGAERWYERIRLSYTGQFQNSLTAKQDEFFKKSLIKDWRNGMQHRIPISATFSMFNYINVTPSFTFTDRMYTSKIKRQWDPNASAEVTDTTYGFYNVYDFQASVSLDTKIYGFWRPVGFLARKVKMIRHVMTPTISLSGSPDFGSSFFGYYGEYEYPDANGRLQRRRYSRFPNALFGVPSDGKSGILSYQLANNLEMKVASDDSVGERKISLIENFTIGQSYNFAADSLNFSNINTSLMLRLTKGFNLNLQATWDVYTYALNDAGQPVRVNKLRLTHGKGLGRLSSTGTSFSYTFNNDTFRRKGKNKDTGNNREQPPSGAQHERDLEDEAEEGSGNDSEYDLDADGYVRWRVPWNVTVNYSIGYSYGKFNYSKMEYDPRITQILSLSGSIRPTPNWNFSFTASYNFDTHRLAYMNCNISRDLHCFAMRASFVPVGPYKSYTFSIAVKSALLSDLKYDKRSSSYNGVKWY